MDIYDPINQISMWEEMFKADISPISPNTDVPLLAPVDEGLQNRAEYAPCETLEPVGSNPTTNSVLDKGQRRLAQNREAARKSRLRKKAYVQQLETSWLKLAQLEQEIERAKHHSLHIRNSFGTGLPGIPRAMNSGIAAFEMEYGHWVEELQKKNCELRNLLQTNVSDIELGVLVKSVLKHYHDLFHMKAEAAKVDVFYLISGIWRTSVERFFLWIGGFRPSELLNILMPQLEPLSDQQRVDVYTLRRSCQQAEDALSQGMEQLRQTLAQCMTSEAMDIGNYGSQMTSALENLDALEIFINQADHLRLKTMQQMSRILTTHQTARGLLALGEYLERFRALSSLWATRPLEPA